MGEEGSVRPCEHESVPRHDWQWLPKNGSRVAMNHPWCGRCGAVAHVGQGRARDLGGLVNRLSELVGVLEANGVRVMEVQKRLLVQRLRRRGADDAYALSAQQQDRMLTEIVSTVTGVPAPAVQRYLRAC